MYLDCYNEFYIGSKVCTLPDKAKESGMFTSNLFISDRIYEIVDMQQGGFGNIFVIALLKGYGLSTGIGSRDGSIIDYTRWIDINLIELVKDQNDIEWYKVHKG